MRQLFRVLVKFGILEGLDVVLGLVESHVFQLELLLVERGVTADTLSLVECEL